MFSVFDALVFTHRHVGYKTYQVRPDEWVNYWPAVLPNGLPSQGARVYLHRDSHGDGIGWIVEKVAVGNDTEAEEVIRRMLGRG